jgi:hydroxyethylthiazole kinase-like uncharacterized protein yjeF
MPFLAGSWFLHDLAKGMKAPEKKRLKNQDGLRCCFCLKPETDEFGSIRIHLPESIPMYIVTSEEMQEMDRYTIEELGIPGRVLMENAGRGTVQALLARYGPVEGMRIAVAAGRGNNGGDGFVIARYLAQEGARVQVFLLARIDAVRSGDAGENLRLVLAAGIPVAELPDDDALDKAGGLLAHQELWVDALLGTGLSSDVRGRYRTLIEKINTSGRPVVAVDIPSGLNADTGRPLGTCIQADLTATFAFAKVGHVVYPGAAASGTVEVVDIGIPVHLAAQRGIARRLVTVKHLSGLPKRRPPEAHKGHNGHLLVIGGSPGKTGAVAMTANAALRTGAGLVTAGVPRDLSPVFETLAVEAMSLPLPQEEDGLLAGEAAARIAARKGPYAAVAVGPGLGVSAGTREIVRRLVTTSRVPLVVDADGINCLAEDPTVLEGAAAPIVLTPHPGEAARLFNMDTAAVQRDRIGLAAEFAARYSVFVVLKGAASVIAGPDGTVWINTSGNPGMASGGMGDVLTGIIAGLISQGSDPGEAARLGAWLHGAAGDCLAAETGRVGYLATDLLSRIPGCLTELQDISPPATRWPLVRCPRQAELTDCSGAVHDG